ncbi:MAG: hypothetical protein ABSB74_11145 [Tepidisphaeraceae bacterium]
MRILAGVGILMVLALTDLLRHGRDATRWREYAFLVLCTAVAMFYGIVNDQITSRISWEYFYYGKDLAPIIGSDTPPNPNALQWQAARIGAAATWWAGLVIGAAMLIANNPSPRHRQLSYARLIARLPGIMGIVALTAIVVGIAGHYYLLNWISQDFRDLTADHMWRPRRFMTTYGIHLGGYFGGAIAVVCSVIGILEERCKSAIDPSGTIEETNVG